MSLLAARVEAKGENSTDTQRYFNQGDGMYMARHEVYLHLYLPFSLRQPPHPRQVLVHQNTQIILVLAGRVRLAMVLIYIMLTTDIGFFSTKGVFSKIREFFSSKLKQGVVRSADGLGWGRFHCTDFAQT